MRDSNKYNKVINSKIYRLENSYTQKKHISYHNQIKGIDLTVTAIGLR